MAIQHFYKFPGRDSGTEDCSDDDRPLDRTQSTFSHNIKLHDEFIQKQKWYVKLQKILRKREKSEWKKYWITINDCEIQFRKNEYDTQPMFNVDLQHACVVSSNKTTNDGLKSVFDIRFSKSAKYLQFASKHKAEVIWWQNIAKCLNKDI